MKKLFIMLAMMTLATGCASHSTAPTVPNNTVSTNETNNAANNITNNNTATATNNTTPGAVPSSGDGLDTSSQDASDKQMREIAYTLTEAYINSHNATTLDKYQQDIAGILGPGLVQFVAKAASSGTDYNHPVAKYDINVASVQMLDQHNFNAVVKCNVQYKGAANTQITYHLSLVDYEGDWLIKLIR